MQWTLTNEISPDNVISERYLRSEDPTARGLTLKEAIHIAMQNNPALKAAQLRSGRLDGDGAAGQRHLRSESHRARRRPEERGAGHVSLSDRRLGRRLRAEIFNDWNFGLNKVLSTTNGTLSATFNNTRQLSNNLTETINPYYNSTLAVSLAQPLLRNFGWRFATINVRLAESAQRQAQWTMAASLLSFVQSVRNNYWNVVLSEENLEVAQESLKFNQDLVRQNAISVRIGTLAPLDLQEAQSSAATAAANVYTAEASLATARAQLRQDVMLNPSHSFLPQNIEPADAPNLAMKKLTRTK